MEEIRTLLWSRNAENVLERFPHFLSSTASGWTFLHSEECAQNAKVIWEPVSKKKKDWNVPVVAGNVWDSVRPLRTRNCFMRRRCTIGSPRQPFDEISPTSVSRRPPRSHSFRTWAKTVIALAWSAVKVDICAKRFLIHGRVYLHSPSQPGPPGGFLNEFLLALSLSGSSSCLCSHFHHRVSKRE